MYSWHSDERGLICQTLPRGGNRPSILNEDLTLCLKCPINRYGKKVNIFFIINAKILIIITWQSKTQMWLSKSQKKYYIAWSIRSYILLRFILKPWIKETSMVPLQVQTQWTFNIRIQQRTYLTRIWISFFKFCVLMNCGLLSTYQN